MAHKLRDKRYLAKLVTGKGAPCAFCLREVDDEITFGKLYAIGDIQCHYFCCLLSCCLIQKGRDDEGLFGFMYTDILAEIERCTKHKCSYCSRNGANLGCSVGACRKQFHLPCGREKNAISLYYGSYKTFCQQHAPKQKIPEHIMEKAKLRMKLSKMKIGTNSLKTSTVAPTQISECESEDMVCVICYEEVDGFPTINTFWPPCCGKDAWFHRSCVQRMALSAGIHYLKCPLCNDKEIFDEAVVSQGYYVPDRDAAWELEQNAFAEIYERPAFCSAETCLCPNGRDHDAENGKWDIKLCLLCGSAGAHASCIVDESQLENKETSTLDQSQRPTGDSDQSPLKTVDSHVQSQTSTDSEKLSLDELTINQSKTATDSDGISFDQSQKATDGDELSVDQSQTARDSDGLSMRYVCPSCLPAAPKDLSALAISIEAIIQQEIAESTSNARRPVMPSRMSIRRTKGQRPSSSRARNLTSIDNRSDTQNTRSSRLELNLKSPRAITADPSHRDVRDTESKIMSPVKLLEQSFREKVVCTGVRDAVLDENVIETLRRKFRKPRPLCEKKKIVNDILEGIFDNLVKDAPKQKEQLKEWCSPKKSYNAIEESGDLKAETNNSKTPDKNQNKEIVSNIYKTPTKSINYIQMDVQPTLANIDVNKNTTENEVISTNLEKEMEGAKETANTFTENCKRLSETINHDYHKSKNFQRTKNDSINEYCRNTRSSISKTNNLDISQDIIDKNVLNNNNRGTNDIETKVRRTSKNIQSRNTKNSTHKTKRNIEKKKTNAKTKLRNTRNSSSRTLIEDASVVNKIFNSYDDQANKKTKLKSLPLKITLKSEKRPSNLNKPKSKDQKSENPAKDQKDVKNVDKEVSIEKRPGSSVSKPDGNILRKLLTDKNLCSQLLLELTTGKKSNTNVINESLKGLSESNETHTANETPKSCFEPLENITQPTIDLTESPTKEFDATTSIERENNHLSKLAEPSTNLLETPTTSFESPTSLIESPINFETSKLKTIDIQQDSSLEISENDQSIKIDVIKIEESASNRDAYKDLKINMPDRTEVCSFKFSPLDKETLEQDDVGIDLESFKKEYLSEVDREFTCNFRHKHLGNITDTPKLRTAIDFAIDAAMKREMGNGDTPKNRKRKLSESAVRLLFDNNSIKKRKVSESDLNLSYDFDENRLDDVKLERKGDSKTKKKRVDKSKRKKKTKDKRKSKKNKPSGKNIEVTINTSEKRRDKNKSKKKIKTKFAIRNENIHVRIKWKKKQLSLNIESKKQAKKEKKEKHSKFKQYVLQFPESSSSKEVDLIRPEKEVCPIKRKYVKQEKSPDNLKQTSIQNFFKLKSEQ